MARQGKAGVSHSEGWRAWRIRLMNRVHARIAARSRLASTLAFEPEPRTIGSLTRGQHLLAGSFQFAGHLIQAPGRSVWTVLPPDPAFEQEVQGFLWLDDLAAVADDVARQRAQAWTLDWVARFGRGNGPGWTPELTGRRVLRWINHAEMLGHELEPRIARIFFNALTRQTLFLSRSWPSAPPGLPRIEALTGLISAGLSLTGMEGQVAAATGALSHECAEQVTPEGGLATRNPEELLDLFSLLIWAGQALGQAGRTAGRDHLAAIERIAPTLRALQHANGGLARFHGGGHGLEGRLDQALAAAGVRPVAVSGLAMGYARLSAARTTVIVDAAAPPQGPASAGAHASTLAMELTSGRRPLLVNCGSGAAFGAEWLRAGRATASHSTLSIDGYSSSRFAPPRLVRGRRAELLADTPVAVNAQQAAGPSGISLIAGQDGYVNSHGLTHVRRLNLSADGRTLVGEDTLGAMTDPDRKRFDRMMGRSRSQGVRYMVRFHLHPDVEAALDPRTALISLTLRSGEVWQFRQHGGAAMTLEASVYLEKDRLKPQPCKQIVLSGTVIDYASQVSWTLAKAKDTPRGIRDLGSPGPAVQA